MSVKEEVDDIVQSFVNNDLSSLDRFGGEADSFSLSPHLAQPSPDLKSPETVVGDAGSDQPSSAKTGPQLTPGTQSRSNPAVTSPKSGGDSESSPKSGPSAGIANSHTEGRISAPEATISSPTSRDSTSRPSVAVGSPTSQHSEDAGPLDRGRNASVSSSASVSTAEREKHKSLGDRFKIFGKRIASGSKK